MHFARRHSRLAPCSDDAVGAADPSLRLAQAVRRALAQEPERADLSLGVMNATWTSGLAAAGLGARCCGLGDALTGINRNYRDVLPDRRLRQAVVGWRDPASR